MNGHGAKFGQKMEQAIAACQRNVRRSPSLQSRKIPF